MTLVAACLLLAVVNAHGALFLWERFRFARPGVSMDDPVWSSLTLQEHAAIMRSLKHGRLLGDPKLAVALLQFLERWHDTFPWRFAAVMSIPVVFLPGVVGAIMSAVERPWVLLGFAFFSYLAPAKELTLYRRVRRVQTATIDSIKGAQ